MYVGARVLVQLLLGWLDWGCHCGRRLARPLTRPDQIQHQPPKQVAGDIMEFPVLTIYRDASMAQVAHLLRCVL